MSQTLLKSTLVTALVLAVRLPAQAVSLILLARLLGADRFGMFAGVAAACVFLAGFATFGTHLTLLRDASRQQQNLRTGLATALGTTMACGAALAVVFVILAMKFFPIGGVSIALLAVSELLIQPVIVILAVPHHASGSPAKAQSILLLTLILRALWITVLYLFISGATLEHYIAGHFACSIFALITAARLLPTPSPRLRELSLLPRSQWRENGGYAVLATTAAAPSELDKITASKLLNPLAAGSYAASARIAAAMVIPVIALMLAMIPKLYRRSFVADGPTSDLPLFWATVGYGAVAAGALYLLAPVLALLIGPSYVGLSDYVSWFAFIVPGMCLRLSAVNLLMTMNLPWRRAAVEMLGAAALVVFAVMLAKLRVEAPVLISVAIVEYGMAAVGWVMVGYSKRVIVSSAQ